MKKVYLSVVSHNDDKIIEKNFSFIPKTCGEFEFKVSVIDNTSSRFLKELCKRLDFNYYCDNQTRGYGANHNLNFKILKPQNDDIFIVCNPDVKIDVNNIESLMKSFIKTNADIYGVKVFESSDFKKWSSHNRSFPALFDPLISLIFKKKLYENNPNILASPDWIGGAFMIFKPKSFTQLNGSDEEFFMYYEDTDICFRAKENKMLIIYNPDFYIIHEARRAGRKIFSNFFVMNFKSMILYFKKHPTFK